MTDQLCNTEAEQAVIGAMLIDPSYAWIRASRVVDATDFYVEKHRWLYEIIDGMSKKGRKVDYLTVVDALEQAGLLRDIGGAAYITSLITATPTALNVEHYAKIVHRDSELRRLVSIAAAMTKQAYNSEDPAAIRNQTVHLLAQRGEDTIPIIPVGDALAELEAEQRRLAVGEKPEGIDPILPSLRASLRNGVIRPGAEVVIGGDPGLGKSMLALFIAAMNAIDGKRVVFIGTEMQARDLAERLAPMMATKYGVSLDNEMLIAGQGADAIAVLRAALEEAMVNERLLLVDRATRAEEIELLVYHLVALYGNLDLVVIDYLQMLSTEEPTRSDVERMDKIVETLRRLALWQRTTIVSISSFRKRTTNEPGMEDFRGTKTITYATAVAWALWKDQSSLEKEAMHYPDSEMAWDGLCLKVVKNSRFPAIGHSLQGKSIPLMIAPESAVIREVDLRSSGEGL